jgi:hypothetical protein
MFILKLILLVNSMYTTCSVYVSMCSILATTSMHNYNESKYNNKHRYDTAMILLHMKYE